MNRLLNELSAVSAAIGQSMAQRCAQTFLFGLVLMVSLGLLGNTMAHASTPHTSGPVSLSQPAIFSLSPSVPLPEEKPTPRGLLFSFMGEALDLELEAEGLLDLTPIYALITPQTNDSILKIQARRPLSESHSFSERNHAPIFVFLQIFRL